MSEGHDAGGEHFLGEVERLLGAFGGWSASERAGRAARERSRTRSLVAQAAATGTWEGLLVNLAERAAPVLVAVGGERLNGRLVGVGHDFCVLQHAGGWPVMLASAHIEALTPDAGPPGAAVSRAPTPGVVPAGARRAPIDMSLAAALAALADERAPVTVRVGAETIEGDLVSVGEDLLSIAVGSARQLTHAPLATLAWCRLR